MRSALPYTALLASLLGCSTTDERAEPPVDAAILQSADATRDAAPPAPADAEVEDPPEVWAPVPAPWNAWPSHPFRERVDPARTYEIIATSGATLLASGGEGLTLLQVDESAGLVAVSRFSPAAPVADLALTADGRTAVLAGVGVTILGLADAQQPIVLGTLETPSPANGVALSADGGTAFVSTGSAFLVLDVRDPSAPARLGSLDEPLSHVAIAPDGQTVFASDGQGLVSVDVRDPGRPVIVGRFGIDGGIHDVAVSPDGATVLVARWQGVTILDVSEPAAPSLLGTSEGEGTHEARAVVLSADGRTLFVAEGDRLRVVDVRAPRAPAQRATFEAPGFIFGLAVVDEVRAVVATSAGALLLDLRNPGALPLLGRLQTDPTMCWGLSDVQLSLDGETAFVVGRSALMALDIADPMSPRPLATLEGPATNLTLSADGRTLFASGPGALSILDVQDPAMTARIGSFDGPSAEPMDVVVSSDGEVAYLVTEGGGGLDVLDLAQPAAPRLSSHSYIRHTRSVVLSADEQTVFVADPYENGLLAIDVRDAAAPVHRGRLPFAVSELALSPDGTTLVATAGPELLVVDVRDPDELVLLSTSDLTEAAGDVAFSPDGATVVLADGPGGVEVIDVTDPSTPTLLAAFDTPGGPTDLALTPDGSTAVVTSDRGHPCVSLLQVRPSTSLEPLGPTVAGTQRYLVRWADRYPKHAEQIAWHATAGTVVVSAVDQVEHTAVVDWTRPEDSLDAATLSVAVGNHHYFEVAHVPAARPPVMP